MHSNSIGSPRLEAYAIRPWYTVVRVSEALRAIVWSSGEALIVDPHQVAVLDALSGGVPSGKGAGLDVEAERDALQSLMAQGFVWQPGREEGSSHRRSAAFWASFNEPADYAALDQTRVALSSVGEVPAAVLAQLGSMLSDNGIQLVERPRPFGKGVVGVVVADSYLNPALEAAEREHRAHDTPWWLISVTGHEALFGPFFRPETSACWRCLVHRLRMNRPVREFLGGSGPPHESCSSSHLGSARLMALAYAATEITKSIAGLGSLELNGGFVSLDSRTLAVERHCYGSREQCQLQHGGDSHRDSSSRLEHPPVRFQLVEKGPNADNGSRSAAAELFVEDNVHLLSRLSGVVRDIVPVEAPDSFSGIINSQVASHFFGSLGGDASALVVDVRGRSGGKGRTSAQARASAFGEAIERHSGVRRGDEPVVERAYADGDERYIHPNACMLFSERQLYAPNAADRSPLDFGTARTPRALDISEKIAWAPLWSHTASATRYLPLELCYYTASSSAAWSATSSMRCCWAETNGAAAGRTPEEAILHGLLELVERDAVAIWWYNRLKMPAVDLRSFDDPYIEALVALYSSQARDLWVLDVTSDVGIPSFVAVSSRLGFRTQDILLGAGTHPSAEVAVCRALTELNQNLPAVSRYDSARNSLLPTPVTAHDKVVTTWWNSATLAEFQYLVPGSATRRKCDFPCIPRASITEELTDSIHRVEALGLEVLIQDQTRRDVQVPVYRVVVPGLRGPARRLAEGRLYEVPVKLGYQERHTLEERMNPLPFFM